VTEAWERPFITLRFDTRLIMKRPFIIGVGGACSNTGKTTLGVLLLQYLTSYGRWGAIKYTKKDLFVSLVHDKTALSQKDKDTGRFIEAGAEDVVWVKSPPRDLHEILPLAIDRLIHLDGLIVEGNSAIEFLEPDIVIFIFGNRKERWKTGIERLAGISDIIIYENESEIPEIAKTKRLFHGSRSGVDEIQKLFSLIAELIHEKDTERRNNKKSC
jgi:molybdopterin-guanine dinucleotide biosynthesis protein MobB